MYRRKSKYDSECTKLERMRKAKDQHRLDGAPPDYPIDLPDLRMRITVESNLLCVLDNISGMCIGEIAMGIKLDPEYIGNMIYKATGMNAEELTKYCKSLNTGE